MRELKFRAWSEEPKSFEFFDLYKGTECGLTNLQIWARNTQIEQYTGLKDNNGKEIYEGDIIKTPLGNKKIIFDPTWAQYVFANGEGKVGTCEDFSHWPANECYIIGNIHENPELLEEEEWTK